MSFFNSFFPDFFQKKDLNKGPIADILLKETINRTKYFMLEYEQWRLANMFMGLQDHLNEMRLIKSSSPEANVNFYRHESNLSNGIYFYLEQPWSGKDYSFFVQYIIERLKTEGYVINNSVREAKELDEDLITVEEFYLKPGLKFRRELPYEQLYGNVHLEIKSKNDKVQMLKVMVNCYSDRNFKLAKSFDEFLDSILISE